VSKQTHTRKGSPIWKIVAVAAIVLVAIGIVVLKPRGDSTIEPSAPPPSRTEVATEERLGELKVPVPPPSRSDVATEERVGEVGLSTTAPTGTEVKPPPTTRAEEKLPVLLDIGSTTCIPCKRMAPILEELKEEYRGVVEIKFIDIYRERTAARKYRIRAIPTQIFYDTQGREFHRHLGYMGKEEILRVFREMGVEL